MYKRQTEAKPWPFNDKTEASDSNEDVEVVDGESEDLELGNDQPEQTT